MSSAAERLLAVAHAAQDAGEALADVLADVLVEGARTAEDAGSGTVPDAGSASGELEEKLADVLAFLRRRLTGEFEVDDFGFDPELTDTVLMALARPLYQRWFRVEVRGIENIPDEGGALVVANHSGAIAIDSLMTSIAVHDEHPHHRFLRMLGADLVFGVPFLGELARKSGATLASNADAERLLARGELVGVWPEGFKGIGKPFSERYKLQRFGRGGFVSAALRTRTPIVPCAIVGAEEIYPSSATCRPWPGCSACRTPRSRRPGRGSAPSGSSRCRASGSSSSARRCSPTSYGEHAAEDPMLVFDLTDQVRQTIQQTLYALLVQRRSVFF